jgi:prolyl oligopeptidase
MNRPQFVPAKYPHSRRVDQVDDLHGTLVADPYRWLEDLESEETRKWVADQNEVTFGYLSGIPDREAIRQRITDLWNYEKFGIPFKEGNQYFYFHNSGLENQSVLYTLADLNDEPRVLLDPNTMSAEGTVAIGAYRPSSDGTLFAYGVSAQGSDWQYIRVRDVATGVDLDDRLDWVKFSNISWDKKNRGFFYSRYDEPEGDQFATANYYQKLYYHRMGTDQNDDVLIYDDLHEKEWGFWGEVSDDGRYLVIHVRQGTEPKSRIYYKDLEASHDSEEGPVVKLLDSFDARYEFVGNDGTEFWILTDRDAPRARLVGIDLSDPAPSNWREIVPESSRTLETVVAAHDCLVAGYLEHAYSRVDMFRKDGRHIRTLDLPGIGTVAGFSGKVGERESFYAYTSFTSPPTIYSYDLEAGRSEVFREPKINASTSDFQTSQVFYESRDGTRVPMFLVHRSDLDLDGSHPTLLYGYGGFNISVTPSFSVRNLAWIEMGGVYAVANIRGGGEYGEEWHQAGIGPNKNNGLDDFVVAAEWLIENRYTSSSRLAINGGSNGGMLVGACMNARPELFRAAVPAVGVMDLLRFHKFTIGWAWTSDYGSPDNPDDFDVLYACSPYHNLREGVRYPATLITTGDHDDRVVPSHSFKFAAAIQAAQAGVHPVLIRIAVSAGHGLGKPTSMQIEEAADVLAFLTQELELRP